MSVLDGGIFSRPRGKTGGIVFGAARTRKGKQVTTRMLVPPSNPNTPAQQTQRGIFGSVLNTIKRIGSIIYRNDWNRAVGQLPGFQSLQSLLMKQMNSSKSLTLVNPINLGILHFPESVSMSAVSEDEVSIVTSTELGSNGTDLDEIIVLAIAKEEAVRSQAGGVIISQGTTRANHTVTLGGLINGTTYEFYIYMRGAGISSGLLSVANPYTFFFS